eukprot:RCo045583
MSKGAAVYENANFRVINLSDDPKAPLDDLFDGFSGGAGKREKKRDRKSSAKKEAPAPLDAPAGWTRSSLEEEHFPPPPPDQGLARSEERPQTILKGRKAPPILSNSRDRDVGHAEGGMLQPPIRGTPSTRLFCPSPGAKYLQHRLEKLEEGSGTATSPAKGPPASAGTVRSSSSSFSSSSSPLSHSYHLGSLASSTSALPSPTFGLLTASTPTPTATPTA